MHLLSDRLIGLVEDHTGDIVKRWLAILRNDPTMAALAPRHMEHLQGKAWDILKHLSQWVGYDTSKEEIERRYEAEGRDFYDMGIPLWEGIRTMYTLRRALWLFVGSESQFDSAFQLSQLLELSDRVILFFDRAEFYMARGYLDRMRGRAQEVGKLDAVAIERIFLAKPER